MAASLERQAIAKWIDGAWQGADPADPFHVRPLHSDGSHRAAILDSILTQYHPQAAWPHQKAQGERRERNRQRAEVDLKCERHVNDGSTPDPHNDRHANARDAKPPRRWPLDLRERVFLAVLDWGNAHPVGIGRSDPRRDRS